MNLALTVYTHKDYIDVYNIFCHSFNKYYTTPIQKYVFCNISTHQSDYKNVFYDEKLIYSKRLLSCLTQINEEIILFCHEDMLLYEKPYITEIEKLYKKIKEENIDFVKLIKTGNDPLVPHSENLYSFHETSNSVFAVQPTLWRRSSLISYLMLCGEKTIWDLEKDCQQICRTNFNGLYWFDITSKKRGEAHWDSNIYPYVATAIVKGKWNFKEYKKEILELTNSLHIDLNKRGYFL